MRAEARFNAVLLDSNTYEVIEMAWYYGTYNCGHEGRVNIIGPTKDRQWKADRHFNSLCSDCYALRKQEEVERLTAERDLPELSGTEKQVAWANTLRAKLVQKIERIQEEQYNYTRLELQSSGYEKADVLENLAYQDVKEVLDFILVNRTEAKYYIDNRDESIFRIIANEVEEALKTEDEIAIDELEKKQEKEAKKESTLYPEKANYNVPAEIIIKEDSVSALYEKNKDFIDVVKSLGYRWDGSKWHRNISETTGSNIDRAAELGNKLLNAGFPVIIHDPLVAEKAVTGDFVQECKRWIYRYNKPNSLIIRWDDRNDGLYEIARSLPGSKWDKGVVVRVEHYKEIMDFANLYGFSFTDKALASIEEYKASVQDVKTVKAKEVAKGKQKDGLQDILDSSREVLDDLRDED